MNPLHINVPSLNWATKVAILVKHIPPLGEIVCCQAFTEMFWFQSFVEVLDVSILILLSINIYC